MSGHSREPANSKQHTPIGTSASMRMHTCLCTRSDSTIPLKSFDYVYDYLARDDKSYIASQARVGMRSRTCHGQAMGQA